MPHKKDKPDLVDGQTYRYWLKEYHQNNQFHQKLWQQHFKQFRKEDDDDGFKVIGDNSHPVKF